MMKTSLTNLSPDQARSWLVLEGFSLYRRVGSDFYMVVRNHGSNLPAICKSMQEAREDTWEYVMSMTSDNDQELDMSRLTDQDVLDIYSVERAAAYMGYGHELRGGKLERITTRLKREAA